MVVKTPLYEVHLNKQTFGEFNAGRRTDFRDQKSRDFSGEIFLERFFWREITAREQVSRAVILEKI